MIRNAITAFIVVLAAASGSPANAISPRFEVMVAGDQVRLSDLFHQVPDGRDAAVTRAPVPGGSMVLDARFLGRVAKLHRLDWEPVTGAEQTIVRRDSVEIGPEDVRAALTAALASAIPMGRVEVILDDPRISAHVPVGDAHAVTVDYIEQALPANRFRAVVIIGADRNAQRLVVSGRAIGKIEVPVLLRWVRAGEVIGSSDIGWIETQYDPNAPDLIMTEAEILGMTPRRPVAVNRPLRQRDFQAPRLVLKGAAVTMVARSRGMVVTARGRALDDGGRGDVIRIANSNSNRIVEGTITGPGEVTVDPLGTRTTIN